MPQILLPRVDNDLAPRAAEINFVRNELKSKPSKATGLNKISAKPLKDAASVIAKPVTYLINLTILAGEIPSQWKEARVTPIYETGKKDDDNNYRHAQFSPWFPRGWNVRYKFNYCPFLMITKSFPSFSPISTETAVVYLVDHTLEHMGKQQLTGATFIDLKKAFNLVDHHCRSTS